MEPMAESHALFFIYRKLNTHFGDLHWWPADTSFEMILGAILTQNTAWQNVERAINNLKAHNLLEPELMYEIDRHVLEELIRPSGYFRIKTSRIKNFVSFLRNKYDWSLKKMFQEDLWQLREKMLEINGIGKETADSILLYAGHRPVFVIDAYTKRILSRHGLVASNISYDELQKYFMRNLPVDVSLYNQYHALIVNAGKNYCRVVPACEKCPLKSIGNEEYQGDLTNINCWVTRADAILMTDDGVKF